MKKIFCAFFCFFLGLSLFAEVNFSGICEKLASRPNMTGTFIQEKTITAINRTLKSSGNFVLSQDGIAWNTLKPFPSTLVVGNTFVMQIKPDGSQTVIDASSNQIFSSISSALTAMFSGNFSVLEEAFSIHFTLSSQNWMATLVPKDSAVLAILKSITVSGIANENSAELKQIVMTEPSSDAITYTFTEQRYPKELSDDEKAFFIEK